MKIARIEATVHAAAGTAPLLQERIEDYRGGPPRPFVVCRVTTDDGMTGYGFTGRFLARQVADVLETAVLPAVSGMDPGDPAAVQDRIRQQLNPRGMTGVAAGAASALDIALWDISGQTAGRSIADMLGGARDSVPVYITFGMPQYDIAQLVEAARLAVADGYRMLKMVVAVDSGGWREDARRIHAVCEAIGDQASLIIDANEGFTGETARALAHDIRDRPIAWFEEPVAGNGPADLARFREDTGMRVGAGQMEADPRIFDAMLDHGSVDPLQPNVLYCGGFTGGAALANRAAHHDIRIANGAGWPLVNMHLLAGVPNGWLLEHHVAQSGIEGALFVDPPYPVDGRLAIPEKPGLGLSINPEGLDATRLE
ncbi:MAG: mandelate racemase/muconate lactonizing enzyme family protein [Alphaproteobacteria bacterium]|nr:mandelate racemase/muconate lactonizing enzyme family protein [Alphaproteobacteria bacterium]